MVLPDGTVVSGTDGSIYTPDGTEVVAPQPIMPAIDEATGVYTYKYPDARTTEILGDTLVDFSEGIVRFTRPLLETRNEDGSVNAPQVCADYTPRTWRLTTDLASDSSPRAFIERTCMTEAANPGMGWETVGEQSKPAPIDRLWVFWRKAGAGIESSTIFYKTYRVGVNITELLDTEGSPARPVRWSFDTQVQDYRPDVREVSGNFGPWEVDRTGRIIYFSEVDERYGSLFQPDTADWLGGHDPIHLHYTSTYYDEEKEKTVTEEIERDAYDIFWLEELPEQSLFGFAADSNVNEGSIYAFADPAGIEPGTFDDVKSSKIWVFWTSTRAGTSDLFWETLSPNFAAR